jgi:hypothetical protein
MYGNKCLPAFEISRINLDCGLPNYDAVEPRRQIPMFQKNLLPPMLPYSVTAGCSETLATAFHIQNRNPEDQILNSLRS